MIEISSDALKATINPHGAELISLRDAHQREHMSSGDPAYWTGRAPLLFPIIGRLNQDKLRVDGQEYTLPSHGFARRMPFEVMEQDEQSALFRLTDTDATLAAYPFAFDLQMEFRLSGRLLSMTARIHNPGTTPLPASFGFHPAFAWPLPGTDRDEHAIVFEADEPSAIHRIDATGQLCPEAYPTPVRGNRLALSDAVFQNDALIWTALNSHRLRYGVPDGPHLDISFPDTSDLGIWTKPGAAFLCVEPWQGHADPEGYVGEFRDKPGVIEIPPGAARIFRMEVTVNT